MRALFISVILTFPFLLRGQAVLDDYIRYGLDNNLALQQKQSDYEKSIAALSEARSMFYPGISFNARYTLSDGGRIIDFPVGDFLNPVYSTLNSLLATDVFPHIDNQQIKFLRPHEQETKLRLIQPVIKPDIYYNSRIKKELTLFNEEDVNQYRRELIAEIKKAWYNVAMTGSILSMLKDTRMLLTENIRVNRKLVDNNKVTIDYLYRSETELSKFDQELQGAENNRRTACAYFNFLLNRPLSDSVIVMEPDSLPLLSGYTGNFAEIAVRNREELRKIESYIKIKDMQLSLDRSGSMPDMYVAVDYGIQGVDYRLNGDQEYVQASAILSWNLFSGFRNRSRIKQSVLEKEMADRQLEEARKQIELQVINTMNELLTAEKGIAAAKARLRSASEGFRLVKRRYGEGQANMIEFIDARTTFTQAEENLIISRFTYLSSFAEFEKVTAINTKY
jgi:outer membrane protein TolC